MIPPSLRSGSFVLMYDGSVRNGADHLMPTTRESGEAKVDAQHSASGLGWLQGGRVAKVPFKCAGNQPQPYKLGMDYT